MKNSGIKFKDIFFVTFSNFFVLLSGLLSSFLLPKIMSLNDFGLYKTFTLYISYAPIVELGFFEGIYLKYTGVNEENYDLHKFRAYFKVYIIINLIVTIFAWLLIIPIIGSDKKNIMLLVVIYALINNIIAYLQILSQCREKFDEYSKFNAFRSVMICCATIMFLIIDKILAYKDYYCYINLYLFANLVVMIVYLYNYRNYVFGKSEKLMGLKKEYISFFKIGFPLLISNLCSTLILTLDRQFVNILFNSEDYAIYAFAYSMLQLITVLTSAISLVLFPALKKMKEDKLFSSFSVYENRLFIMASIFLLAYYPIEWVIRTFLPTYIKSLDIFLVILPTLGVSIVISVLIQNFFKVLKKTSIYFIVTLIVLVISFILNYIFYVIFKTMISISIASLVTSIFWYIISIFILKKWMDISMNYNLIKYVINCFIFIVLNIYNINIMVHIIVLLITILILWGKDIRKIVEQV